MDRRTFLCSTSATALGVLLPDLSVASAQQPSSMERTTFEWSTPELTFAFWLVGQRLSQGILLPTGVVQSGSPMGGSNGVVTALQCTGENSPDSGMKQGTGGPGNRLVFTGKREETTAKGRRFILSQNDPVLGLNVDSYYESFAGVPVVRRWAAVRNTSQAPVGIDFLSSAMLHALADPQDYENELVIHLAYNSWMAEGQWHSLRPSQCGLVENLRTSWSQASAGSIGSWSTEKYLPMAMAENTRMGADLVLADRAQRIVVLGNLQCCFWQQSRFGRLCLAGRSGRSAFGRVEKPAPGRELPIGSGCARLCSRRLRGCSCRAHQVP